MAARRRTSPIAAIFVAAICCAQGNLLGAEPAARPAAAQQASPQIDVASRYTAAANHFREQQWREAAEQYQLLLKTDAEHPLAEAARFYLAESLLHAGDCSASADAWLAYLAGDPQDAKLLPAARFRAGECCYLAGRRDDASRELNRFVADYPDAPTLPRARLYLGNLAALCGDYKLAGEHFAGVVESSDDDELRSQAVVGLAQALLHGEEPDEAWSTIRPLYEAEDAQSTTADVAWIAVETLERLNRLDDAQTAAERFLELCDENDPRRFDALLKAARLLEKRGKREEAAAAFRELSEQFKPHGRGDVVLYEFAWLLRELGRDDEALKVFERLVCEYPQSALRADGLYRLAEADLTSDRVDAAAAKLREAATLAGDELLPHVFLLQARTALASAKPAEAEAAVEQLATKFPRHELAAQAGFWRAEIALQSGRAGDAADQLAALLETSDAATNDDLRNLTRLRQAQALSEAGRWGEVLSVCEVAKKSAPANAYEFELLAGRAHTARAELQEARAAYERVAGDVRARGTESAATARFFAAETFFHQRNYETALGEYRRCAAEHKPSAWAAAALLQSGKCLEQLGRRQDAQAAYDALLAEHATSPYADDARTRRDALLRQSETAGTPVQRK